MQTGYPGGREADDHFLESRLNCVTESESAYENLTPPVRNARSAACSCPVCGRRADLSSQEMERRQAEWMKQLEAVTGAQLTELATGTQDAQGHRGHGLTAAGYS